MAGGGRRALVISPLGMGRCPAAVTSALRRAGFRVVPAERWRSGTAPDLVVAVGSQSVLAHVRSMRTVAPQVPIFVVWRDRASRRFIAGAYDAGATSVVPAARIDVAWRNLSRLIARPRPARADEAAEPVFVPAFRDPSGRVDASRVAAAMGLSMAQLARVVRVPTSVLARRPTAAAAQPGLREMEFCWAALLDMLGEADLARAWLHASHPDFSGKSPLQSLIEGGPRRLGDYLRAALAGESA